MVVPIRDFGNKSLFTLATHTSMFNITPSGDMDMVINNVIDLFKNNCNNYNEVRDHTIASNTQSPRTLSMFSSDCNKNCAVRVQYKSNNMVEDNQVVLSNSSQLKYTTSNS